MSCRPFVYVREFTFLFVLIPLLAFALNLNLQNRPLGDNESGPSAMCGIVSVSEDAFRFRLLALVSSTSFLLLHGTSITFYTCTIRSPPAPPRVISIYYCSCELKTRENSIERVSTAEIENLVQKHIPEATFIRRANSIVFNLPLLYTSKFPGMLFSSFVDMVRWFCSTFLYML